MLGRKIQRRFQRGDTLIGRSFAGPPEELLEHLRDGVERRIFQERRRRTLDPRVRRAADFGVELLNQTRLPDPRFTHDRERLSRAGPAALPDAFQRLQFFLAADERRKAALRRRRVQPAAHAAWPYGAIDARRALHALEAVLSAILHDEQTRHQAMRRRRNEHAVRVGRRLNARSQIRRIAEKVHRLSPAVTHDNGAGMDADANREFRPRRLLPAPVQLEHLIDNAEAGARRSLSVVLMRMRPSEISDDAVAEILGDVTAKASDRLRGRALIRTRHLAPILGVETSGDGRRVDQVRKQNREPPPFAFAFLLRRLRLARSTGRDARAAFAAELIPRPILGAASRALDAERMPAPPTKFRAGRIVRAAVRTACHQVPVGRDPSTQSDGCPAPWQDAGKRCSQPPSRPAPLSERCSLHRPSHYGAATLKKRLRWKSRGLSTKPLTRDETRLRVTE